MNLVDGVTRSPVPVGSDASLARSEDTAHRMVAVSRGDLAAVVTRNLLITRSVRVIDALLLVLRVREVRNFEWWERLVVAEEVPAQDLGKGEPQQDCFGMLVAQ